MFDVTGYFVPDGSGATFVPLPPPRGCWTVDSATAWPGRRMRRHSPRTFQVAGRGGVPASAVAVTGSLTATGQSEPRLPDFFLGSDRR